MAIGRHIIYRDNIRHLRTLINSAEKDTKPKLKMAMMEMVNLVAFTSAAKYLQGPRPDKLGVVSSRLIRSMIGATSFRGVPDKIQLRRQFRGTVDSIRQVTAVGKNIIGLVGTKAKSKRGFDYPAFHEKTDRAFLKPAVRDSEPKFPVILKRAVNDILEKFRGKQ